MTLPAFDITPEGLAARLAAAQARNRATCLPLQMGRIVATPAALARVGMDNIMGILHRHEIGDWGDIDPKDAGTNDGALGTGGRILSVYQLDATNTPLPTGAEPVGHPDLAAVWIITDAANGAGRPPATTVMLPEDY